MRKKIILYLANTLFASIAFFLLPADSQMIKESVVIEGKVVAESTGKPVTNAHVFIVDGEEETLTNSNGEFSLRSWQKTPIKLTVEKLDLYQRISIVISDPSRKQVIRLKNKP